MPGAPPGISRFFERQTIAAIQAKLNSLRGFPEAFFMPLPECSAGGGRRGERAMTAGGGEVARRVWIRHAR
jgi:hypothetical protein